MSGNTKVDYRVILTFDVDVKGETGIYKEVSDLLAKGGLTQQFNKNDLPSNTYTGDRRADVTYEGASLTIDDVKNRGDKLNNHYWKVVNDFFDSKKLKHSIFVSTSYLKTTSTKHE
ncbi:Uncharacterised protein [Morganella morganii]|uniref:hypothetical protein n=1 Tax=Morganella morganii TaxID=582 RepID=UPI000789006A|nr:hypothetical protein [Morganella morganii]QXO40128.1 hypothetical protein JL661_05245 [Morganella morganii]WQD68597.1 hypothetical protein U0006_05255 [Morganella morganii]VDY33488.1 Uncharacterised protein [Morganella morganii]